MNWPFWFVKLKRACCTARFPARTPTLPRINILSCATWSEPKANRFRSSGVAENLLGESMSKAKRLIAVAVLAIAVAATSPVRAQDFYKDKTLTIIVGYSPGGSFDLYARVLARYIGRYLPGKHTRGAANMHGARGLAHA